MIQISKKMHLNNKLFIVICGLTIAALLYMSWNRYDGAVLQNDPETYDEIAQSLWNTQGIATTVGYHVILPPGYALLRGVVKSLFGNNFSFVKVLGVILLIVTSCLLYKTISLFMPAVWSRTTVFLWISNGYIISGSLNGYADLYFTCIFITFIYAHIVLCLAPFPVKRIYFIGLGCVWAMLFYIRPEGLVIGCFGLIFLFRYNVQIQNIVWYGLVFLVLTMPYFFFIKQMTGFWQLSGKSYANLVLGEMNSPYQNPQNTFSEHFQIISRINENPDLAKPFTSYFVEGNSVTGERILWNLRSLSNILIGTFSVFGFILAIIGLIYGERLSITVSLICLIPCVAYVIFFYNGRVVSIYHFVWAFWMMLGVKKIYDSTLQNLGSTRWAGIFSLGAVAVISIYQSRLVYLWYLR